MAHCGMVETASVSEVFAARKWKQNVFPKRWHITVKIHGVTSQNVLLLAVIQRRILKLVEFLRIVTIYIFCDVFKILLQRWITCINFSTGTNL